VFKVDLPAHETKDVNILADFFTKQVKMSLAGLIHYFFFFHVSSPFKFATSSHRQDASAVPGVTEQKAT
jgi:hypothetical protein